MFDKKVYVSRRRALVRRMTEAGEKGLLFFLGNVEAPAQYKDNCYKWRQESCWLYYFGLDEPRYAAILDLESGEETVYADDVTIDDIIWMGPQESVAAKAESVGVAASAPYTKAFEAVRSAKAAGRRVHFLPQSRYYNNMVVAELFPGEQPSDKFVETVISQRIVKEPCEIEAIDDACLLGYEMHSLGRDSIRAGVLEQDIVGRMEGLTLSKGWGVSFPTILTQHGETLHNHLHDKIIEPGKLMVIDAGAESNMHYASDFTRTYPTSGKFTSRQREIYQIVCDCNEFAYSISRPGITYRDVHIQTSKVMLEGLRDLGLVSGDIDEMVYEGVPGLFQPHGLGHNMGLDVHDMEDLGENLVGYDRGQKRSLLPGLGSLRMARELREGFVITDEPGIYFIPALIEKWKKEGLGKGFVTFSKLEGYYDFGGIRIEDDVLVTADGARRCGPRRLPVTPDEVEEAMAAARKC